MLGRAVVVVIMVGVLGCSTTASPSISSELHSTPGRTACGASADCASYAKTPDDSEGQPFCCLDLSDPPTCYTGNLAGCESGIPFYCDEAADCAPGLHCCNLGSAPVSRTMFACMPSCGSEIQLCQTNAECENGKACKLYVCRGPYGDSEQPLATCGPLSNAGFGGLQCVALP